MGVPRSRGALGGLQKLKDIRHDGYQSYSDFSPENESKVATSLRFQRRFPQGSPWGSQDPGSLFLEVFKELNATRHVGYQSHSVLSFDHEYRVAMVKSHNEPKAFLKLELH